METSDQRDLCDLCDKPTSRDEAHLARYLYSNGFLFCLDCAGYMAHIMDRRLEYFKEQQRHEAKEAPASMHATT